MNPAVILAVDPGRNSGYCIMHEGKPVTWGTVRTDTFSPALDVVTQAGHLADRVDVPLVMVGERWGVRGRMNPATAQGLGGAWKMWTASAMHMNSLAKEGLLRASIAKSRILRVHTATWRGKIFGRAIMKTAQAKHLALSHVAMRFGLELDPSSHDAAEAILIGLWATHAPEVRARIPNRYLERSA